MTERDTARWPEFAAWLQRARLPGESLLDVAKRVLIERAVEDARKDLDVLAKSFRGRGARSIAAETLGISKRCMTLYLRRIEESKTSKTPRLRMIQGG